MTADPQAVPLASLPLFADDIDETPTKDPAAAETTEPPAAAALLRRPTLVKTSQPSTPVKASHTTPPAFGVSPRTGNRRVTDAQLDWSLVAAFRNRVSKQLSEATQARDNMTTDAQRELGRSIISELLHTTAQDDMNTGRVTWSLPEQQHMAEAVFNAVFGLGRLQPLVDADHIENIEIMGNEASLLEDTEGNLHEGPPVAETDDELTDFLAFLASHSEANERSFSESQPRLHIRLDGGARLAASAWTTPRPVVMIRRHRLREISLTDLVDRDALSPVAASFLSAAIKAKKTVVVAGPQGAGKALALDTPIPTPTGWTSMGDLQRGDLVFDEQGRPCRVLTAHSVQEHRPCYQVVFDDGSTITSDADHLWRVTRRRDRERERPSRAPRPPAYYVSLEERERLHAIAEASAEEPDIDVTVAELVNELGDHHRDLLFDEAKKLVPTGHVRKTWTSAYGALHGRDIRTYSRQALLKSLAVRRETPRPQQQRGPESVVLTTEEMAASPLWAHENKSWRTHDFAIDLARPLLYPRKQQFIDPYVLGIWLGDGATSGARISTADPEVLAELEAAGYPCTPVAGTKYDYGVGGSLHVQLRVAGLLGDKHIPAAYRLGDPDQRFALLQGLMDSDGTCSKSGNCQFTSTLPVLAEQTLELVFSLGYKAHLSSKPVRWQGRLCGYAYTVSWTTRDPVFRLPRKLERQSLNDGGPSRRYIVAINRVESVPVRCITVDSSSSLFLASKACVPTHNTTMVRALCGELSPWERIGTFETEYELGLHEMPHRHRRIIPWEARPGSGERGLDGRAAGEITLDDLLYDSFRFNLQRYIIGEIRGREILALIKAVQSGEGSISTTHAANARAAVDKLVTCALEAGPHITEAYATRAVTEHIDLIVQLTLETKPGPGNHTARRSRYVSEIYAVEPGENGRGGTHVFHPSPTTGRAVPHVLPDPYRSLEPFGFRLDDFNRETTR